MTEKSKLEQAAEIIKPALSARFDIRQRVANDLAQQILALCEPEWSEHIDKQLLLDAGINVFGLDLLAESFLKLRPELKEIHNNFCLFYRINRKDCAEYAGVNILMQPVLKPPELPNE